MHVERLGSGPRLVLVHGSVAPGWLTWIAQKPPAFGVAPGHSAVEEFLEHFEAGAPKTPRAYLEFFLPLVGSSLSLRDPLPPAIEARAPAAIAERSPHEAVIPLDDLAAAPFPKLVVSGGHNAAF